jgi:hypothetical protein
VEEELESIDIVIIETETVYEVGGNSLRVRRKKNPWSNPPKITGAMKHLASKIITTDVESLIKEIEGEAS